MSLPATDYWFSLSIRRNRKSFLIATVSLWAVAIAVVLALIFFSVPDRAALFLGFIFGVPWVFVYWNLSAQRLRDFNVTGWLVLLWIPINLLQGGYAELSAILSLAFWIILLFVPGTKGENRYGADPLEEY